jgi:hypothetical protein
MHSEGTLKISSSLACLRYQLNALDLSLLQAAMNDLKASRSFPLSHPYPALTLGPPKPADMPKKHQCWPRFPRGSG